MPLEPNFLLTVYRPSYPGHVDLPLSLENDIIFLPDKGVFTEDLYLTVALKLDEFVGTYTS
jgi:hypothetical protein